MKLQDNLFTEEKVFKGVYVTVCACVYVIFNNHYLLQTTWIAYVIKVFLLFF